LIRLLLNSNILQDSKTLKFSKEQSNTKSSNKEAKEKKNNKKIKKNIYIYIFFLAFFVCFQFLFFLKMLLVLLDPLNVLLCNKSLLNWFKATYLHSKQNFATVKFYKTNCFFCKKNKLSVFLFFSLFVFCPCSCFFVCFFLYLSCKKKEHKTN